MPCNDDVRTSYEDPFIRAALCAVVGAVERSPHYQQILGDIDWREAGVTRDALARWWERHKEEDRQRRQRESADQQRRKLAAKAMDKLTAEERRALGL